MAIAVCRRPITTAHNFGLNQSGHHKYVASSPISHSHPYRIIKLPEVKAQTINSAIPFRAPFVMANSLASNGLSCSTPKGRSVSIAALILRTHINCDNIISFHAIQRTNYTECVSLSTLPLCWSAIQPIHNNVLNVMAYSFPTENVLSYNAILSVSYCQFLIYLSFNIRYSSGPWLETNAYRFRCYFGSQRSISIQMK